VVVLQDKKNNRARQKKHLETYSVRVSQLSARMRGGRFADPPMLKGEKCTFGKKTLIVKRAHGGGPRKKGNLRGKKEKGGGVCVPVKRSESAQGGTSTRGKGAAESNVGENKKNMGKIFPSRSVLKKKKKQERLVGKKETNFTWGKETRKGRNLKSSPKKKGQ